MHVCSYMRFVYDGGYTPTHFVPLPIHLYLLWKRRCRRASYCLLQSSEVLQVCQILTRPIPLLTRLRPCLPSPPSSPPCAPCPTPIHLSSLSPSSFPPYNFTSIFADVAMSESNEPLFASLASNTTCVHSVRTVVPSVSSMCSSSSVPLLSKSSAAYASYSISRRDRHPMAVSPGTKKTTSEMIDFLS